MEKLVQERVRKIDDLSDDKWLWPITDTGAWGSDTTGPIGDWIQSHKDCYYKYVKKFDTVITAGANCGMYARFHGNRFKAVYAFEPDYLNFYCLVHNNPEEHIFKFNCALGSGPVTAEFTKRSPKNVGMHKIAESVAGNIPVLSIDSFSFNSVDLIQLDVEGSELNVLEGAVETITTFKPVVIAERGDTKEIKALMEQLNYEYKEKSIADHIWVPKE